MRHSKSGKRVWPVDLGFLNPRMRPALYQLLSKFQPPSVMSIPLPAAMRPRFEEWDSDRYHREFEPLPIFCMPRLTYERAIVLARRTWYVPSERVPTPTAAESDADYFRRVERWRAHCGLPERFYVRVIPRQVPQVSLDPAVRGNVGAAEKALSPHRSRPRTRRDDRKPQYIDLANPLLVGVLGRLGGNLPLFALAIEEAIPDTEHAVESADGRYLVECMLQFDHRGGESTSPTHAERHDRRHVSPHAD
jgi:hypothetical protein